MTAPTLEAELLGAMADMPIIDAHEHLPPEAERTGRPVDFATLFSHYTQTDLKSAGMTEEQYQAFQHPDTPLDRKWELFEPYWPSVRYGSYARPALIAAREFYGCEDITAQTYQVLSERMQAANTPGIYDRVLRDKCGIQCCLTQIGRIPEQNRDLLVPLLPIWGLASMSSRAAIDELAAAYSHPVSNLDDCLDLLRVVLQDWKRQGVVGLKMVSTHLGDPSREDAARALDALMGGKEQDFFLLHWFLHRHILDLAGELGLIVAVHCGIIWNNWNNFYENHPRNLIPVLLKHRNTTFDIYHAGIPWPRHLATIGKDFPNAYLNLCWCHIISQAMTVSLLDEWMDMVPVHKITGFGGDYNMPVEKVFGHLQMAKEDIARMLARRVGDRLMTEGQAVEVAQGFLYDNPKRLYGLDG